MKTSPSLITIQEQLMARLEHIAANGVGDHKHRSRGRAISKTIEQIERLGFTTQQARAAALDARDMADLAQLAEEDDDA